MKKSSRLRQSLAALMCIFALAPLGFFGAPTLADSYEINQCTNAPRSQRNPDAVLTPEAAEFLSLSSLSSMMGGRTVSPAELYANKLFVYLTGSPKQLFDPRFQNVVGLVQHQRWTDAAALVMGDPNFLKVRVRAFSIPFIDVGKQPQDTLTDLQTLIIGITRDELDARLILTGNLRYSGYGSLGLPPVSRANNDHFAQFENQDDSFDTDLEKVDHQWDDLDYVSGAFTTRAWAAAYYKAGTNRLAVKFALDAFLCTPIDMWKIAGIPDSFVRRDVTRQDGGDPSHFENTCRNCHAAMDAMGGAFAKLDFTDAGFVFQAAGVVSKMNKNQTFYPAGYVTTDDSWVNLLYDHPTIDFGWRTQPNQGMGLASFANMLANSKAFSRCMVQKVFSSVCGQKIQDTSDASQFTNMVNSFESSGYNLKQLFATVATEDACISHPPTPGQTK